MTEDTLGTWTEQLVAYGSRLVERRRQFMEKLDEYVQPIHAVMTEQSERLTLVYHPSFGRATAERQPLDEIQQEFREALSSVRLEERRRQACLVGPHRDDLGFLVNGRDVRTYGSQGQQRTAALSVKLAEVELMRELAGEAPVCLLDDVFSELDALRRAHLFEVTLESCQTLLSTTDVQLIPPRIASQATVFEVREGELFRQ